VVKGALRPASYRRHASFIAGPYRRESMTTFSLTFPILTTRLLAERKRLIRCFVIYALIKVMEHEYPVPSYMASVFQKPDSGEGWKEVPLNTKKPVPVPTECDDGELRKKVPPTRVLAIDCEMVCLGEGLHT
jgi:hypothetical protein